jgi:acyl-CoA-binding protein
MSDIDQRFEQAQEDVKGLSERPGNLTLLRLYALYKQAAAGDAPVERPGMTDFTGRYKHDAWSALAGMPADEAKTEYITLVASLVDADAS